MKFQLLFSYLSYSPPKNKDLLKLVMVALKPALGDVQVRELRHYSVNPMRWIFPVEVETARTRTPEQIEAAIKSIERAAGVHLVEVKELIDSEPPAATTSDDGDFSARATHSVRAKLGLWGWVYPESPAPRREYVLGSRWG